jgi:hypothetical protein
MTEKEIDKLKTDLQREIEDEFTKKYFLLRRTALWAFLGGIFAFAVAVGVVSHQTALKAVTDPAVEAAKRSIIDNAKTATHAVVMIKQNLETSRGIEERIKALEIGIPPAQRAKIIAEVRAADEEAARKKAESEPRVRESHR